MPIVAEEKTAYFDSPVGPLFARLTERGLATLSFANRPRRMKQAIDADAAAVLHDLGAQLREYFLRRRTSFDLPLAMEGPQFHVAVWKALCDIPYGETISYGELAKRIGMPDGARAVGAANGANPIVIIVPCHRVIGANGDLVGYGGGLWRKRTLLDLEAGRAQLPI